MDAKTTAHFDGIAITCAMAGNAATETDEWLRATVELLTSISPVVASRGSVVGGAPRKDMD
jgi:hypothetical protein